MPIVLLQRDRWCWFPSGLDRRLFDSPLQVFCTVTLEKTQVPHWVRGEETGAIDDGRNVCGITGAGRLAAPRGTRVGAYWRLRVAPGA
jgi:hypothetical protein